MRLIIITIALVLAACSTPPTRTGSAGTAQSTAVPLNRPASRAGSEGSVADTGGPGQTGATTDQTPVVHEADVWKRIQSALTLERHLEQDSVQDKVTWFERNQEYLDRVAERANPYLYYIVEELERRGMPLDLALLPVIESAYHPLAYSPSRAAGIWQFIPSTGKRYGLKQNWWYDGRRDIVAATGAALDYLQELHTEFDGDWLLAVAAYNAGELNVERAISRNRSAGKKIDFWSLQLPRETRGYVPSLLAVTELVAHPGDHGIALRPIPNQPYFSRVELDGQLDLATAAALADMSMDEMYTLNPGFNQWATDPDGPHYLMLPVGKVDAFKAGLEELPEKGRVQWTRYEIRTGETLGGIATRYHTSVEALRVANNLRTNVIHVGNSLLIPNSLRPAEHYTLSMDNRRNRGLKKTPEGKSFRYVVARGDSLWEISRRYDVSVAELCRWNGIAPGSVLRLGQELELRAGRAEPAAIEVGMQTASADPVNYTVQKGDSLWQISKRFGVSVSQLQEWNGLHNGNRLQPGQILVLYRSNLAATGA